MNANNQMFSCPTCGQLLPLAAYLGHATQCGAPKDDANEDVNLSNDDSVASSREQTPATLMNSQSPMINGNEQLVKRPRLNDVPVVNGYGQQVADGNVAAVQIPLRADQRQGAPSAGYRQQQALPANLNQSRPANAPVINNSPIAAIQVVTPPAMQRQEPQPRPQEQPVPTPVLASTPLQVQSIGATPLTAANAYQPQYANSGPQGQVLVQTPASSHQISHARRLKEELTENHVGGAAAAAPAPAPAQAPNLNIQDLANAVANAILPRLEPRLRLMENQIGDVRRRVEMFEASMMLKLATIETAINQSNNHEDDLGN